METTLSIIFHLSLIGLALLIPIAINNRNKSYKDYVKIKPRKTKRF
jgi:hypothetical protein